MRKLIVVSCLLVLVVCSSNPAFAQFVKKTLKEASKSLSTAANTSKLERTITQTIKIPVRQNGLPVGSEVMLTVHKPITQLNKVNASLLNRAGHISIIRPDLTDIEINEYIAMEWAYVKGKNPNPTGKGYYTDQATLARDLNALYEGEAVVVESPTGLVKLYELPVDGIWYKPAGYKKPIKLSSDEYFVIYDMERQTGQLVNKSAMSLFEKSGD